MAMSPKVSIVCTAFNHERYIRQTLNGFMMQKTNFPFEVLISDDASTDNTAEIIREFEEKYPDVIKPMYVKENLHNQGIACADILFRQAQGEYVAWCEGDDFWIDENKLQMQTDYMDTHPDYALCAHAAYNCYEDGVFMEEQFRPFQTSKTVTTEEAMSSWLFATASLFYRNSMRPEIPAPFQGNAPSSDYSTVVYLALNGKVYYIDKPMCVYRRNSVSSLSRLNINSLQRSMKTITGLTALADRIDDYSEYRYTAALDQFRIGMEHGRLMLLNEPKLLQDSRYRDEFTKKQKLRLRIKRLFKWALPIRAIYKSWQAKKIYKRCRKAMSNNSYPNVVLLDAME